MLKPREFLVQLMPASLTLLGKGADKGTWESLLALGDQKRGLHGGPMEGLHSLGEGCMGKGDTGQITIIERKIMGLK